MHTQLVALAADVRRNAVANRTVERIGPFVATFTERSNNPFLNYAIPDDGATPSAEDVRALIAAFQRHRRTPRLGFFEQLAPAVSPRLGAAGFTVENRLALMTCTPADLRPVQDPEGMAVGIAGSDAQFLAAAVAQGVAFLV